MVTIDVMLRKSDLIQADGVKKEVERGLTQFNSSAFKVICF
jgi:hypothetical protein